MKMGNRKFKALDRLGVRVMSKPDVPAEPINRQQRRAKEKLLRRKKKPS